jgi:hypothetical protein
VIVTADAEGVSATVRKFFTVPEAPEPGEARPWFLSDRLVRVGEAVLEITGECHPCSRMEDLRPGLRETLGGQRGMLARVAKGGTLRVGDAITVEVPSA